MPREVSSYFIDALQAQVVEPVRRLWLQVSTDNGASYEVNTVDATDYVMSWPRIKHHWNKFQPNNIGIKLANADQYFNRLHADGLHLVYDCVIQVGVNQRQLLDDPGFHGPDFASVGWTANVESFWSWQSSDDTLQFLPASSGVNVYIAEYFSNSYFSSNSWQTAAPTELRFKAKVNSHTSGEWRFRVGGALVDSATLISNSDYGENYIFEKTIRVDSGGIIPAVCYCSVDAARCESAAFFLDEYSLVLAVGSTDARSYGIEEFTNVFQGNINRMHFRSGTVDLSITDKWDKLTRILAGTKETPYVATGDLAHVFFWSITTSAAGLSSIESTSNPDIDYAAFEDFTVVSSSDQLLVSSKLDGQKVSESLAKFGRLMDSAIYVNQNNKLTIKRFLLSDTLVCSFGSSEMLDCAEFIFDETNINNRVYVAGDYDPEVDTYALQIVEADTASVNSYGLYEKEYSDEKVWLVDSTTCVTLANRRVSLYGRPTAEVSIKSTMYGIGATVGDTIHIDCPITQISDDYRVLAEEIDLDKLTVKFDAHRATLLDAFILDSSLLDGTDILT